MYRNFLLALRWSLRSMFEESKLEITAMGKTLSVDGKLSMRWRLHLWPKGVMSHALDFMAPILQGWGFHLREETHQWEAPAIVEGYSNYEFDPWTAQITKHTVDIKNPPLFITDLLRQYSVSEAKTALPYGIPLRFQAAEGPESSASLAGATLRGESRRGASTIARAAKARSVRGWAFSRPLCPTSSSAMLHRSESERHRRDWAHQYMHPSPNLTLRTCKSAQLQMLHAPCIKTKLLTFESQACSPTNQQLSVARPRAKIGPYPRDLVKTCNETFWFWLTIRAT